MGEQGGPAGIWREQSGVTQRNRAEGAVNIKAEVAASLLGEMQLPHRIMLQLHFAANMRKEGKMCSSSARYTAAVAAASTTSLLCSKLLSLACHLEFKF